MRKQGLRLWSSHAMVTSRPPLPLSSTGPPTSSLLGGRSTSYTSPGVILTRGATAAGGNGHYESSRRRGGGGGVPRCSGISAVITHFWVFLGL